MDHYSHYYEFIFKAYSPSPPLLFVLVGIYHVPLPAEYFSVFSFGLDCCLGWAFYRLEVCVSSYIVEAVPCEWGWTSGLSRFPGYGSSRLSSGGWSWISSLWSAMKCPVVSFGVSMGFTAILFCIQSSPRHFKLSVGINK